MERLPHLIHQALDDKEWKSIRVARHSLDLSHMFFADDLLVFGQTTCEQLMKTVKQCLKLFCLASRNMVNVEKTKMIVSKNVHISRAQGLERVTRYGITDDLGKYLGVPILHSRQTKATYEYLVEKVQKRMSSWKAQQLSFVEHVTSNQSVLASILRTPCKLLFCRRVFVIRLRS